LNQGIRASAFTPRKGTRPDGADRATRFVTQVTLYARELGVAIAQTSFDTGESHDPKVSERQMAQDLGQASAPSVSPSDGSWHQVPDILQAAAGADALLLLTEWQQFAQIDWPAVAAVMRRPAWLFDTPAKADAAAARWSGLQVWTRGGGLKQSL
jgi:hypothetical protein